MTAQALYVCDTCGQIEAHDLVAEDGEWTCPNCGTHAAWEFPPEARASAKSHAAHISRLATSRLLRRRTP